MGNTSQSASIVKAPPSDDQTSATEDRRHFAPAKLWSSKRRIWIPTPPLFATSWTSLHCSSVFCRDSYYFLTFRFWKSQNMFSFSSPLMVLRQLLKFSTLSLHHGDSNLPTNYLVVLSDSNHHSVTLIKFKP